MHSMQHSCMLRLKVFQLRGIVLHHFLKLSNKAPFVKGPLVQISGHMVQSINGIFHTLATQNLLLFMAYICSVRCNL